MFTHFFFWKVMGMLKLQQNTSSSILCFGPLESSNHTAPVLRSFFSHHNCHLLSCQTVGGWGCEGNSLWPENKAVQPTKLCLVSIQ